MRQYGAARADLPRADRDPRPGLPAGHDRHRAGRLRRQRRRLAGAPRRQDRRLRPDRAGVHPSGPGERRARADADGNPVVEPDPAYFQSRPSAAGAGYDPLSTSASNLGPENEDLIAAVKERRAAAAELDGVAPAQVPPDALLASGSGLDPHISPAYAGQQVARVARERGLTRRRCESWSTEHTQGRILGFLGEPRVNVLELNLALDAISAAEPASREAHTDHRRRRRHGARKAARLPRRRARGRQDLRHARRGTPPRRARHRRRRRVRRDPRPPAHRGDARRARGRPPPRDSPTATRAFTEMDVDAVLARRPAVALVDELAHTNVPGSAQREALAGRRGAARGRHRRHLHGQHPAPRVAQRRRREDHRRSPARAGAGRRGARRRPGRARRHGARGAAPADGARQRLRRREGRRRARQLLPASGT